MARKKTRKWVRLLASVSGLLTLLLTVMGVFQVTPAAAAGDAVPEHTVVAAGQLAVWEIINNADPKSIKVWGGTLPSPLTTSGTADVYQVHAWIHYANAADAQAGACEEAKSRAAHTGAGDWFPGYPVFLNDVPFTGSCGSSPAPSAPPAGPTQPSVPPGVLGTCDSNGVMRLTAGTWSPTNTPLINREHNWTTRDVWIWTTSGIAQPLWVGASADGRDPLSERAVWIRCDGKAWSWILDDAMTEAANVAGGSLGYTPHSIHVNGQLYTGSATPGVKASQRVADGVTIPQGSALITRQSFWDTRTVWIWWTNSSPGPLTAGWSWDGNGQHHQAIWTTPDYKPWGWIEADACAEAVEVWKLGLGWYPKHLYINGVEQPTPTCPDP